MAKHFDTFYYPNLRSEVDLALSETLVPPIHELEVIKARLGLSADELRRRKFERTIFDSIQVWLQKVLCDEQNQTDFAVDAQYAYENSLIEKAFERAKKIKKKQSIVLVKQDADSADQIDVYEIPKIEIGVTGIKNLRFFFDGNFEAFRELFDQVILLLDSLNNLMFVDGEFGCHQKYHQQNCFDLYQKYFLEILDSLIVLARGTKEDLQFLLSYVFILAQMNGGFIGKTAHCIRTLRDFVYEQRNQGNDLQGTVRKLTETGENMVTLLSSFDRLMARHPRAYSYLHDIAKRFGAHGLAIMSHFEPLYYSRVLGNEVRSERHFDEGSFVELWTYLDDFYNAYGEYGIAVLRKHLPQDRYRLQALIDAIFNAKLELGSNPERGGVEVFSPQTSVVIDDEFESDDGLPVLGERDIVKVLK